MLLQGEDGSGAGITSTGGGGFEFGVDPNDDPELALALRVSMEEQRARQQAEGGETNFCQASGLTVLQSRTSKDWFARLDGLCGKTPV